LTLEINGPNHHSLSKTNKKFPKQNLPALNQIVAEKKIEKFLAVLFCLCRIESQPSAPNASRQGATHKMSQIQRLFRSKELFKHNFLIIFEANLV
jgi:hypothetical protein